MNPHFTISPLSAVLAGIFFFPMLSARADNLAPLSDEFDHASSLSDWERLYEVEQWGVNQLETWNIDSDVEGSMRMAPYASSWFRNLKGVLVFKTIEGDFIVTTKLTLTNRNAFNQNDPAARPGGTFSLAGIFAHGERPGLTPETWSIGMENYIFLSFGRAGNSGSDPRHQCEVKTTVNSSSNLYFTQNGIPSAAETLQRNEVMLQMIRVGDTALVMRRHPGGEWIVENRYPNNSQNIPLWGDTLQVGITTYTDWATCTIFNSNGSDGAFAHNTTLLDEPGMAFGQNYTPRPDLIADVDYVRYERPDPAVTEEALQTLATSFETFDVETLPDNGVALFLGDHANTPLRAYRSNAFDTTDLTDPATALDSDYDGDGKSTLLEYLYGTPPETADSDGATAAADSASPATFTFPHNAEATAASALVESSGDLTPDSWTTLATRAAGSKTWQAVNGATVAINGDNVTVTEPTPTPADIRRFFRISVSVE